MATGNQPVDQQRRQQQRHGIPQVDGQRGGQRPGALYRSEKPESPHAWAAQSPVPWRVAKIFYRNYNAPMNLEK